jgi:hypothetical protein
MERLVGKRIVELQDNGRIVVLADGSAWLIDPADRKKAVRWKKGTLLRLSQSGEPESRLTNADTNEEIRVAYAGQR